MKTSLDQTASEVLQLLARLDQEVTSGLRKFDKDAFASVARPDVQAGIARAPMDGQKVEVTVKTSQDSVLLSIFDKIGGSRSQ